MVKQEQPKKLSNHIEEYFTKTEGTAEARHSRELFQADKSNVDIKTDLTIQEIILINKLMWNDDLLRRYKLKPVFSFFVDEYLRLKISLDRKSRSEFVSINRADRTEEATKLLSNLSNIGNVKK